MIKSLKKILIFQILIILLVCFNKINADNSINDSETIIIDAVEYEKLISEIERTTAEIKKIQQSIEKNYTDKITEDKTTAQPKTETAKEKEPMAQEIKSEALQQQLKIMIAEFEKKNSENKNLLKLIDVYKNQLKNHAVEKSAFSEKIDSLTAELKKLSDRPETVTITKIEEKLVIQPDSDVLLQNNELKDSNALLLKQFSDIQTLNRELLKKQNEMLSQLALQKAELNKYTEDNIKLRNDISKFKESVKDYEATILSLNNDITKKEPVISTQASEKQHDIETLEKIKTMTTNLEKAGSDNQNLAKMIEIYKNQIQNINAENSRLSEKIAELSAQLEKEKNKKTGQPVDLKKYTDMLDDSKNRIELLNEMLMKKQEELMSLRAASARTENTAGNNDLIISQEQNNTLKEQNSKLATQLETARLSYQELTTAQNSIKEELNKAITASEKLSKENEALKNELKINAESLANYEKMLAVLKNDLFSEGEKFQNQSALLETLQNENTKLKQNIDDYKVKLQDTETSNANLKKSNEQTATDKNQFVEKFRNMQETEQKLTAELAKLKNDNATQNEKIKGLENVIKNLNEQYSNESLLLSTQLKEIELQYKDLYQTHNQLKKDYEKTSLEKKNQIKSAGNTVNIESIIKNYEDTVKALTADRAELIAQCGDYEKKQTSLNYEIGSLTEKINAVNAQLETVKTETSELQKKLDEKDKNFKTLDLLNKNLQNELDITTAELEKLKAK